MPAPITWTDDAYRKRLATLQARAALAGFELHRLEDGRLLAARWGLTREFPDASAVEQWLARLDGGAR